MFHALESRKMTNDVKNGQYGSTLKILLVPFILTDKNNYPV